MKQTFTILLLAFTCLVEGQNIIDWNGTYQLQLSDFQSKATQIGQTNNYSLYSASGIDFSFAMSNAEFMFTKNFNSKVNCTFNRNAASIVAPDSSIAFDLVDFARYQFDLSELYARKFRQKMYEDKGAFSDVSFFRPIYDTIQQELVERQTIASQESDMGRNKEKLNELHQAVLKEIAELSDFCKSCKPPKKKK